jgi:DNA adenine methylase
MKPLLKWPGGKTRELPVLEEFLQPPIRTYLEPFVGGGAVLFSLAVEVPQTLFSRHPPARALVADVNPELVALYQGVGRRDPELRRILEGYARIWDEELPEVAVRTLPALAKWFQESGREEGATPPDELILAVTEAFSLEEARPRVRRGLVDKLRRSRRLEIKHGAMLAPELIAAQLETGLRAGFYTYLRDDLEPSSEAERAAVFFFQRCYCYGSMFRQNRAGRFNIPYGGKGYNNKRMAPKLAELFSQERSDFLSRVEVHQQDFREFFAAQMSSLGPEDLVFLDPPYDSEFQEYAGHRFGEVEQRALGEIVARLPCRILGIMQATPLIREIYQEAARVRRTRGAELHLEEYEKTYAYNVRGRNQRDVSHLLLRG